MDTLQLCKHIYLRGEKPAPELGQGKVCRNAVFHVSCTSGLKPWYLLGDFAINVQVRQYLRGFAHARNIDKGSATLQNPSNLKDFVQKSYLTNVFQKKKTAK